MPLKVTKSAKCKKCDLYFVFCNRFFWREWKEALLIGSWSNFSRLLRKIMNLMFRLFFYTFNILHCDSFRQVPPLPHLQCHLWHMCHMPSLRPQLVTQATPLLWAMLVWVGLNTFWVTEKYFSLFWFIMITLHNFGKNDSHFQKLATTGLCWYLTLSNLPLSSNTCTPF